MKNLVMIFIALISIRAQADDCRYMPREDMSTVLSELPKEVSGLINCAPKHENINVFMAARLPQLTEMGLSNFVMSLAKSIDISAVTTEVTWTSTRPLAQRQLLVKTSSAPNSNGEQIAMLHYAFVMTGKDGVARVVVHSMDTAETMKIKSVLNDVQVKITAMDF